MEIADMIKNEVDTWIALEESNWDTLLTENTDEERTAYLSALIDKAQALSTSSQKLKCYQLFEFIKCKFNLSVEPLSMLFELADLGMEFYSNGDMRHAENAFSILCSYGDSNGRNNYAYMIRRGESSKGSHKTITDALKLLRPGVIEREPFACVNTALALMLNCGKDDDWHIADELMSILPNTDTMTKRVKSWWKNVGEKGETEGFLVHFFLLRHQLIQFSEFGSIKSLAIRLSNNIESFPNWLAEDYALETLDDVIDCIDEPDFDSLLEDFLDNMPSSRESVDEMLETVSALDLWSVYNKLLTDCVALLSPEELAKLKADYKEKFSVPFPNEDE